MIAEPHFDSVQIVSRLLAAVAAGAAIGIDREWRHKSAGLRTHMLYALASAAMAIMALEVYLSEIDLGKGDSPDATRVLQGIITGMAFLGAGVIIRGRHNIHGLTTGAGLWLAGALGLIFGLGLYTLGVISTLIGVITLTVIQFLEPKDAKGRHAARRGVDETFTPD